MSKYQKHFESLFGTEPEIIGYAPGRVEVLGNHTDYNEGFVLSAAINSGIYFLLSPSSNQTITIVAGNLGERVEINAKEIEEEVKQSRIVPHSTQPWFNYIKGVLFEILKRRDQSTQVCGFNALMEGDLEMGSGLSSSAALEISTAIALSEFYNVSLSKHELAKIGQSAEHQFVGVKCGLLDQISSLFGKENHLVKTNFRSLEVETLPLGKSFCFLLCNTGVSHSLVASEYNERRESCEKAALQFGKLLNHPVTHLVDVNWDEWQTFSSQVDEVPGKRAAHVIGENKRVLEGKEYLNHHNISQFGKLMFESHQSSRIYFENSCQELDAVVEAAKEIEGVYGARLSGGGFGGSAVILADVQYEDLIKEQLMKKYEEKTGKQCKISTVFPFEGALLLRSKKQEKTQRALNRVVYFAFALGMALLATKISSKLLHSFFRR